MTGQVECLAGWTNEGCKHTDRQTEVDVCTMTGIAIVYPCSEELTSWTALLMSPDSHSMLRLAGRFAKASAMRDNAKHALSTTLASCTQHRHSQTLTLCAIAQSYILLTSCEHCYCKGWAAIWGTCSEPSAVSHQL